MIWRKTLRSQAAEDESFQIAMLAACKESILFWLNAFGWTYRLKQTLPDGTETQISGDKCHAPFITWPIQDETIEDVLGCITKGEDVVLTKSRDMGATWLILSILDWMFLFRKNFNAGICSRKEVLVDSKGDMDSLFEKVRYLHRMLPDWMLPKINDRYMHMQNLELGSTLAGESTNTDVGRGGRKSVYLVDEAAAIMNAGDIESSLSQNTPCQIWISTPKGPNTAFHKKIKEGRGRKLQMPWWRHPEKSLGAKEMVDESGAIVWTGPFKQRMDEKYSKKTVAQELEMDHGQSGDIFFDYLELERHRQDHVSTPLFTGEIVQIDQMPEEKLIDAMQRMDVKHHRFIKGHGRRKWRFWVELNEDGRPPQYWTYVFGIDVSHGAGDSNSVISVRAKETGMIVAKWWDAYTSPEELAIQAAIAGVWFGGLKAPAFLCWENNGPGGIFGRKIVKLSYPTFYRQRIDNSIANTKTPRWGWHSNLERKEALLGAYRDAIARDRIIVPCSESLDEAADYIYNDAGQLIPAKLREETMGGRKLHGDHVIADALTVLASDELPKQRTMKPRPPAGTFAHRQEARRRKDKKRKDSAWNQ